MRVKVCGITRAKDAELVIELGGWALGFILLPGSIRACKPEIARGISRMVRRQIKLVGVFINAPLGEVVDAADTLELTHIQLSGDEGPSYCLEAAHRTGCEIIKGVSVKSGSVFNDLQRFYTNFHLLDAALDDPVTDLGDGKTWDWSLVSHLRSQSRIILSGGLTEENVVEGVRVVKPWAVSVSAGVESSPGVKDEQKLRQFFDRLEAVAV